MMHEPDDFKVVSQSEEVVVLFAMCKCGDENCGWTATTTDFYNYQHKTDKE